LVVTVCAQRHPIVVVPLITKVRHDASVSWAQLGAVGVGIGMVDEWAARGSVESPEEVAAALLSEP
jgi:hypothetical protein